MNDTAEPFWAKCRICGNSDVFYTIELPWPEQKRHERGGLCSCHGGRWLRFLLDAPITDISEAELFSDWVRSQREPGQEG